MIQPSLVNKDFFEQGILDIERYVAKSGPFKVAPLYALCSFHPFALLDFALHEDRWVPAHISLLYLSVDRVDQKFLRLVVYCIYGETPSFSG